MGNRYEVNRGLREAHADPSIRVPRIQLLQSSRSHLLKNEKQEPI